MDNRTTRTTARAYDRKLARILRSAAKVFARDGYGGASIRKVAADAEVSLAGLYHYVRSKEELLYLIQFHTFTEIVDALREGLEPLDDPEERFRAAVHNHVRHFAMHMDELRVCAVELNTLSSKYYDRVAEVRREYFKLMLELVQEVRGGPTEEKDDATRLATLSLFGSLNWFYQWYDADRGLGPDELAEEFASIFMYGFIPRDL